VRLARPFDLPNRFVGSPTILIDGVAPLPNETARLGDRASAAAAWQAALNSGAEEVTIPAAVNLATLAAVDSDFPTALAFLQQAAEHAFAPALDYAAVLKPSTRTAACARLSTLEDTDSLNFRGIGALADSDRAEACKLWTASRDQGDMVAPLLLKQLSRTGHHHMIE